MLPTSLRELIKCCTATILLDIYRDDVGSCIFAQDRALGGEVRAKEYGRRISCEDCSGSQPALRQQRTRQARLRLRSVLDHGKFSCVITNVPMVAQN